MHSFCIISVRVSGPRYNNLCDINELNNNNVAQNTERNVGGEDHGQATAPHPILMAMSTLFRFPIQLSCQL